MKKGFVFTALLVLVAALAFANGSTESATTTAATGPKAGGTLKVLITSDPASLDDTTFRATQNFYFYETILLKDASGNYYGQLVKNYEADIENLTYTLNMRDDDIYFHDGTILTSEVLAWNINEYKRVGVFASSFNKIDYAEAKDAKTVVIHLKEWDMLLPNCLTRMCKPVSKAFIEKYGYEGLKTMECGTGPFTLKSWERDSSISVAKFDKYHEGAPLLDGIDFIIITSADVAVMALQNGEVDVILDGRISPESISTLRSDKSITVYDAPRGGYAYTLGFHTQTESDPLYDVRVREAICLALDADTIGQACTDGQFLPGSTQWSPNNYAYCSPNVTGFEYNVEKAKALLAEAGYPNGFKTKIHVQTQFQGVAVYVQSYLKAIGVDAEINPIDTANFSTYIGGWREGMMIHTVGVANGQEYQLLTAARSDNPSGYGAKSFKHSAELDALVKQAYNSDVPGSWEPTQKAAEMWFQTDISAYVLFLSTGAVPAKSYLMDAGICKNGSGTIDSIWTAWLNK